MAYGGQTDRLPLNHLPNASMAFGVHCRRDQHELGVVGWVLYLLSFK